MRVLGWTRQELDSASPEDVGRVMWVLDAERVARLAERLDEAASVPLPESGPLRARALLDVAEVAEARNALDRYLEGPEDDVET